MKNSTKSVLMSILSFGAVIIGTAIAQHKKNSVESGGWATRNKYFKIFNRRTIQSIIGEVISINTFIPLKGMTLGVHLMLKTDKGVISAHLGPTWYLENQNFKIDSKEKIEVIGSFVIYNGKPTIISIELRRDTEVLKLRDWYGLPFWHGISNK